MAQDKRLREIVRVLSSYGIKFAYNHKLKTKTVTVEEDAANLRKAFEKLGPSFIKIGQILSTRLDILPDAFVKELSHLQDQAPQFPFEEVERIFLEDTGLTLGEAFLHIEEEPLASASIAQVHRGTLRTGEEVIVKVQRPVIDEMLVRDLDILIRLSSRVPKGIIDVIDPKEAFEQVKQNTLVELDFRNEAKLLNEFREVNKGVACVGVPKVYMGMTTRRVLVEEYIEGIKVTNQPELEELGYDMEEISRKLMLSYLKQIFRDGFFHGDPHPGNIIIEEGKIYFIDFGIMGRLPDSLRTSLNRLIETLATRDIDRMVKVCLELATPRGRIDKRKLYDDLERMSDSYFSANMKDIRMTAFITDFIRMFKRNNLAIPSELTILAKALSILEGLFQKLAPELNLIGTAREYLKESRNWLSYLDKLDTERLAIYGYSLLRDMAEVPGNMNQLLKQVLNGRLRVKIDMDDLDKKWRDVRKMSNRVVMSVVIVGILLSSAIMSGTPGGQYLGQAGFVVSGLFGIWLLISIYRSGNL